MARVGPPTVCSEYHRSALVANNEPHWQASRLIAVLFTCDEVEQRHH